MTEPPPLADESDPVPIEVYRVVEEAEPRGGMPWFKLLLNGEPVLTGANREALVRYGADPDYREAEIAKTIPLHLRPKR